MKKKVLIVAILLLVVILVISGWKLWEIISEYAQGAKVYSVMEDYVSIPESILQPDPTEAPGEGNIEQTQPEEPAFPEVDFEALWEQNPDVVGWIYIPDTKVNYPILQGEDNDKYLYRLITGKYNSSGSIFLEADIPADFSSQNNPIYGHNMKNGTMFAPITRYKEQKFYDAHPTAYLVTPECNYLVHLFSAYVTSAYSGKAWTTSFSQPDFEKWLKDVEKRSYFASDVVPTVDDRVLTFSTCTYETDDARFVVHGVMEAYNP